MYLKKIIADIFQNYMEDKMLPDTKQNKHKEGYMEEQHSQKFKSQRSREKWCNAYKRMIWSATDFSSKTLEAKEWRRAFL